MAKDFFDEEYEKKTQKEQEQKQSMDSWYNRPAPEQSVKRSKPMYIALLSIALVLCIAFGWVLGYVFQGIFKSPASEGGDILNSVIEYLQNNYYEDIDEEDWTKAIEMSGTALMQYAGDRFSQLMSPQTYYDFNFPTSSAASSDETFGLSMYVEEGIGLYVSSVTANSNAYGYFFPGDIILRLSDIEGYNGVPSIKGNNDEVVEFPQINLGEWASTTIKAVLYQVKAAKFHVLRLEGEGNNAKYSIVEIFLERGVVTPVSSKYNYEFIEFYFDDQHTNISMSPMGKAKISTYEERGLEALPAKTGYVRIDQFMDVVEYNATGSNSKKISAYDEFKQVMELFRELGLERLVLDLKGNPGGNVQYVTAIAGMLITDARLTAEQKSKVTKKGELLITYLEMPKPAKVRQNYYQASSYYNYFGAIKDKCDIIVWTDGNSASASELLTGTLLDYGTAVQMGTTTYGKGIAQTWQELPFTGKVTDLDGKTIDYHWAVYYTCAKYYSPFDNNIQGKGYTPQGSYNNLTNYKQLWDAALSYWA